MSSATHLSREGRAILAKLDCHSNRTGHLRIPPNPRSPFAKSLPRLLEQGHLAIQLSSSQPDGCSVWSVMEQKICTTRNATLEQLKAELM
ncbi:unnamed protein product [Heligmosomoides polygyrus]|uniref:Uncharacterized protein n=1 Tax=Heligmosomoides polygyrus TaxID=6339 RepID=A0A183FSB0_HELPZ|nr:unnamed protein product [Heligmosomoides polygyrus]